MVWDAARSSLKLVYGREKRDGYKNLARVKRWWAISSESDALKNMDICENLQEILATEPTMEYCWVLLTKFGKKAIDQLNDKVPFFGVRDRAYTKFVYFLR